MDRENAGLFERFDESGSLSGSSGLLAELAIRPAREEDTDALGRISADREGGDVQAHRATFRRSLENPEAGRSRLILVAELGSDIVGFGKVRYVSEEHGAGVGATPEGWYLTGVVVDLRVRRRGVGARLTAERLKWIAERSCEAYYFANVRNRVSIELHRSFGFAEVARGAEFAGVSFVGGEGILFRAGLAQSR
jgi:aminoglycoside 6'-N-acetyltransferase I